ncbi:hypothetical protein MIND_01406100 [Mycena indigotica]|uniref:Uncharacterized protein n=1 Tax=Mycena indigotica TaxID=2126181 RepID=A0A8H6VR37_9AGAR|nr:uncharacterized protein MIND_01406100 [Mycena indigotica]KAF7288901.1 hypothetical protein MIND_01406100 [Mycena indigotica]
MSRSIDSSDNSDTGATRRPTHTQYWAMHKSKARSKKLVVIGTSTPALGLFSTTPTQRKLLSTAAIQKYRLGVARMADEDQQAMSSQALDNLAALQNLANDDEFDATDLLACENIMSLGGVLDGTQMAVISHAGGEFDMLEESLKSGMHSRPQTRDWRTRRERTQRRVDAFTIQLPHLLQAYLRYCSSPTSSTNEHEGANGADMYPVTVVEMFGIFFSSFVALSNAVVDAFLECTDDDDAGGGYDVACNLKKTIATSNLGKLAEERQFHCLVGAFHGHAHNRLCQLEYLTTYIEGLGLEDLETLERFFSRSNGLAWSCRNASIFHRQQEITTYFKHVDTFESYPSLSKFICDNYRQAIRIIDNKPAVQRVMAKEGIEDGEDFVRSLQEEKEWLLTLKSASSEIESSRIRYIHALKKMETTVLTVRECRAAARQARNDDATYTPGRTKADINLRHAEEHLERDERLVQELEVELGIAERWKSEQVEYQEAEKEALHLEFTRALNRLELLLAEQDIIMAAQIEEYAMRRHRFDDTYPQRFQSLTHFEGFTGSLVLGEAVVPCAVSGADPMVVDDWERDGDAPPPADFNFDVNMDRIDEEHGEKLELR